MRLDGTYGFLNNAWVGKIKILELIEVAKTEEELFLKLNEKILSSLNNFLKEVAKDNDFSIEILDENNFSVRFYNSKQVVGLIFKKLRGEQLLSQKKVSRTLECRPTSYSQYEEGKREPSLSKFSEILDALGYKWSLTLQKK